MFEVYKRHTPMFALSEIRQLTELFTESLQLGDTAMAQAGVEVVPLAQTVRINENNPFIVKSTLSPEQARLVLRGNPVLAHAQQDTASLLETVLRNMAAKLAIDAYVTIGSPFPAAAAIVPPAAQDSHKPLMIFNAPTSLPQQFAKPEWYGMDHPALWIGHNWMPVMDGVEAFFAISPEFKREVGLNRYEPLERFGDFSVGLVRF